MGHFVYWLILTLGKIISVYALKEKPCSGYHRSTFYPATSRPSLINCVCLEIMIHCTTLNFSSGLISATGNRQSFRSQRVLKDSRHFSTGSIRRPLTRVPRERELGPGCQGLVTSRRKLSGSQLPPLTSRHRGPHQPVR